MTRVRVDFNNLVRDGQVRASLRNVEGHIAEGDLVEAYDPEEQLSYEAAVASIDKDRGRVYLVPHWEKALANAEAAWSVTIGRANEGSGVDRRVKYTPQVPTVGSVLVNH